MTEPNRGTVTDSIKDLDDFIDLLFGALGLTKVVEKLNNWLIGIIDGRNK